MNEFDDFVWLRIASHLQEYIDVCSLAGTCRILYHICSPLKKSFSEFHVLQLETQGKSLDSLLENFEISVNHINGNNTHYIETGFFTLCHKIETWKRKFSDIHFVASLKSSTKQALVTCIDRQIEIDGYHCFRFDIPIRSNKSLNYGECLLFYTGNIIRESPELFSYAFDISHGWNSKEDSELIFYDSKFHCGFFYLWVKDQSMPSAEICVIALNSSGSRIVKRYIHNRLFYAIEQQKVYLKGDQQKWYYFQKLNYIYKTKPISQKKLSLLQQFKLNK